jgi:isoquinoline 1-oxidoreductase subunit alpha
MRRILRPSHYGDCLLGGGEIVVDGQYFGAFLSETQNRGAAITQTFAWRLTGAYDDGSLVLKTHIIGPGVLHYGRMSLGLFRADNRSWRRRMSRLVVNGKTHDVDADPNTPLLWVLREQIGLTGTKYGCGIAQCGACTVHIDGAAVRSCSLPVSAAEGKQITTIEGLAKNGTLHPVQKAWLEHDVPQCGYCQTGMIMAVAALLNEKPKPTDADIDNTITNICRCGTFQQVREAIHAATSA